MACAIGEVLRVMFLVAFAVRVRFSVWDYFCISLKVLFLDIAMPKGKSRKELIKRYDDNLGFPTPDMVKEMKDSVETINNMKTFSDWYKVMSVSI